MVQKLNNKIKKTNDYSLVYFGAGWDFSPISKKIYNKFNHHIYIDALPNLIHYKPGTVGYNKCKDRESFINTLKNQAKKSKLKLINIDNNLLTFKNNKINLEYYINTTVEDSLTDPDIRKKLNKAIWIHQDGFYPHENGLKVGDLPNILECRAKISELD